MVNIKDLDYYNESVNIAKMKLQEEYSKNGVGVDADRMETLLMFLHFFYREIEKINRANSLKEQFLKAMLRYKTAEKLSVENPVKFEKFISEFNELCEEISWFMKEYKELTGEEIGE